jgi:hypothetical protein
MSQEETPTNTYTLSDLTRATKRRFGPTKLVIGEDLEVVLPSIFRLPRKTREAVYKALREVNDLDDGTSEDETEGYALVVEAIADILRLVTPQADALLNAVEEASEGDVLVASNVLGQVLAKWMENTQVGEA